MTHRARHRPHHGPVRLSARRRRTTYIVGGGLWLTGVLWLCFHYFMAVKGSFGLQPHPTEIWWLRLHAAFGFMALWSFGMVWSAHIVAGWHSRRQRWTGGTAFVILVLLVASGYLIYYLTDDGWHDTVATIHWIIGLTLPVAMAWHIIRGRRRATKAAAGHPDATGAPAGHSPRHTRAAESVTNHVR